MHLRRNQCRFRKKFIHLRIAQWSDGSYAQEDSNRTHEIRTILQHFIAPIPRRWEPIGMVAPRQCHKLILASAIASAMARFGSAEWWIRVLYWHWTLIYGIMLSYSDKTNRHTSNQLRTMKMIQQRQATRKECAIIRRWPRPASSGNRHSQRLIVAFD